MPGSITATPPRRSDSGLGPTPWRRLRILFVGEAVTLAHAARIATLARALDPDEFQVSVALDSHYDALVGPLPGRRRISSLPQEEFMTALARGRAPWSVDLLRAQVQEDLRLFEDVAPDVVVGDMRLSLAVSTRLARIPYANLVNAYWCPDAPLPLAAPDHWATDLLGPRLGALVFRAIRSRVFAAHARPLDTVLARHRLPVTGDLRRAFSQGDLLLHPDPDELIRLPGTRNRRTLGPLLWSPPGDPGWEEALEPGKPLVYVCLGSSGRDDRLEPVLQGLAGLDAQVLVATAGRRQLANPPANARVFDFLPGDQVCARASLVVTNGGSPSCLQALAAGAPVLAVPGNLDQLLSAACVARAGAGALLRTQRLTPASTRRLAERLLGDLALHERARRLEAAFSRYDAGARLSAALTELATVFPRAA